MKHLGLLVVLAIAGMSVAARRLILSLALAGALAGCNTWWGMKQDSRQATAWTYDKKPSESYYQTYWSRLRKLDYEFLRSGDAVATALRFTLSVPGVHTAIVGTTKPERWQENAALLERGQLPDKEFARIRQRWHEVAGDSWQGQV